MMYARWLHGISAAVLTLMGCTDRLSAPSTSRLAERALNDQSLPSATAPSSVVWETRASTFVVARSLSPIVGTRAYALLALADYAAIAAIDDDADDDPGYGQSADDGANYPASIARQRGAVAGASAQVLSYLFPLDVAAIENLLSTDAAQGSKGDQHQFARGVNVGRAIGDLIVARGRADGFMNANGTPKVWDATSLPSGPDIWAMDADATPHFPAGFQFPFIKPYYLTSADQFRPPAPPTDLTAAVNEVIAIVHGRTPEQLATAIFWNGNNRSPVLFWNTQAAAYIAEHGMGERDAAHVFALANSAGMDATIGCWDAKFYYLVRRPWQVAPLDLPNSLLVVGRPNHPSYPSGHSCVSSAVATVLKGFFPEKSATLDQELTELGLARVYAGIHYRMDVDAGRVLGTSAAAVAIRLDREQGILRVLGLSGHDE